MKCSASTSDWIDNVVGERAIYPLDILMLRFVRIPQASQMRFILVSQ